MGRACSTNWGDEECVQDIGGKARRKEPLGRPRRSWVDNIKMDWIEVAEDRDQWRALVNTMMKFGFLKIAGNFLNGCTIGSFSGRAQLRK
jgi:hypothetical protein